MYYNISLKYVIIYQSDIYKNKDQEEKIYEGSIMDIPWYITDMYIDNDDVSEGIGVYEGKFIIYVREVK